MESTGNSFKQRYINHKSSFNNTNKRHTTELANYILNLKGNNTDYKIKIGNTKPNQNLILNLATDFATWKILKLQRKQIFSANLPSKQTTKIHKNYN